MHAADGHQPVRSGPRPAREGRYPRRPLRAARCPPAECPAIRIGPVTSAAAAPIAEATDLVIAEMRNLRRLRVAWHCHSPAAPASDLRRDGKRRICPSTASSRHEGRRRGRAPPSRAGRGRKRSRGPLPYSRSSRPPCPDVPSPRAMSRPSPTTVRPAPRFRGRRRNCRRRRSVDGFGQVGHGSLSIMNIGPPRQRGKPKPLIITTVDRLGRGGDALGQECGPFLLHGPSGSGA